MPDPAPVAAVVLAAGASARFGPGPAKALAPVDGGTALGRIVRLLHGRSIAPIVIVTGGRPEVAGAADGLPVDRVVENPAWEAGRTGSIQTGLREVAPERSAFVWPVDVPFVAASTLDRLLHAVREDVGPIWWTPVHDGRGGHPVALGPAAVRQVLAMAPDTSLRKASFRGGTAERRVPVDDPGILDNLNTHAAFLQGEAAWRLRGGR